MFGLTGKTALVTGAGQGVGQGIATALSEAGAKILVNDIHPERAQAVVDTLKDAEPIVFDVTDYEAAEDSISGHDIDILVNNAGIPESMSSKQFKDTQPSDWFPYIDINLYGVLNCTRLAINQMCEKGWGRVIIISSGAGTTGLKNGVAAYGAGKGGGVAFMRHLAIETADLGVTANAISLGLMDKVGVPDQNAEFSDVVAKMMRAIPIQRMGTPADVGALCIYLASTEASWMTGQNIHLNGGSLTF